MKRKLAAVALILAGCFGQSVSAQELVGSYVAVIGPEDLYNSKGQRLTEPWQILRQDRANYHRFGIRHRGDTDDSFFASKENRATMERMLMQGQINPRAVRTLVNGYSDAVLVRIYGRGSTGKYLDVTIFE